MGRLWLALAFIAALAGTAAAKREPVCACATNVTLPRPGATNVPTNARFWTIPASRITSTPDQPIQVYQLAPHKTYELSAPKLTFTTGDGPDDTPPVEPRIGSVSITLDHTGPGGMHPIALLRISGTFSTDIAVLRVTLTAPSGAVTFYTTPDDLSICNLGLSFAPGNLDVEVTAIDIAGNTSSPVTYNATATVAPDDAPRCHVGERSDDVRVTVGVVLTSWFVLALAMVIWLTVTSRVRARRRGAATCEPIALPAVETLARAVRRGAVLRLAALGVVASLAAPSDLALGLLVAWGPVFVTVAIVAARGWSAATHVLRLTSYEGATATVRRDEVHVTIGGQHATLRAAPRRVDRAKAAGVPRATI